MVILFNDLHFFDGDAVVWSHCPYIGRRMALTRKQMPPDCIVRPFGIWNSRAPFHTWLPLFKSANRVSALSVLCTNRIAGDLDLTVAKSKSIKGYLTSRNTTGEARAAKAWQLYRASLGKDPDGALRRPQIGELKNDLGTIVTHSRHANVIQLYSIFETFLNCWVLNYLLAKLEANHEWTESERRLAQRLSPLHGKGFAVSVVHVFDALPDVARRLSNVPHVFRHPTTQETLLAPIHPMVNVKTSLDFWREFRNRLVHTGGLCTPKFARDFEVYWNECLRPLGAHIPELKSRSRLPLLDRMSASCQLIFYRAALSLNDWLEEYSEGRRGHPWAPSANFLRATDPVKVFEFPDSGPLLLPGDHDLSYKLSPKTQRNTSSREALTEAEVRF